MVEEQKNIEAGDVELVVEESKRIEEGKHVGKIVDITYRDEPFQYIDFHIEIPEKQVVLKAGYPARITPDSSLGKLLKRLELELKIGEKITLSTLRKKLLGKDVAFLTQNEETDLGTFARIVPSSLKKVD